MIGQTNKQAPVTCATRKMGRASYSLGPDKLRVLLGRVDPTISVEDSVIRAINAIYFTNTR